VPRRKATVVSDAAGENRWPSGNVTDSLRWGGCRAPGADVDGEFVRRRSVANAGGAGVDARNRFGAAARHGSRTRLEGDAVTVTLKVVAVPHGCCPRRPGRAEEPVGAFVQQASPRWIAGGGGVSL